MLPRDQVEKWKNGESIHDNDNDQCVPDYSCCYPLLKASAEERKGHAEAFIAGDIAEQHKYVKRFVERFQKLKDDGGDELDQRADRSCGPSVKKARSRGGHAD